MTSPGSGDKTPELTPESRAILVRARRAFVVSMAVLLVGFVAIAFALIQRASSTSDEPFARYGLESLSLPAGAEIVSLVPDNGALVVTYRDANGYALRIIDARTGKVEKQIAIGTE